MYAIRSYYVLDTSLNMQNRNLVVLAKIDHILLKADVQDSLEKGNFKDVPSHTSCNFGQWYAHEGLENFTKAPTFQAVAEPHQRFHELLKEILEFVNKEDMLKFKEQIKAKFVAAEAQTTKLFTLMDRMLEEQNGNQKKH